MAATHFSGPVHSTNGFVAGSGGTTITQILKGTVSVNPASLADGALADTDVTIAGAAAGDTVVMNPPAAGLTAGIAIVGAWVSAANTVKVRLHNASGGTVDEDAANWTYTIIKS